jgi:hypothetical protein
MTVAPEDRADYRFFRMLALTTARWTGAGLFFIVWALIWAREARWEIGIFLGSTTFMLVMVSLVAATTSYLLYKRRGGVIVKGPRGPPGRASEAAGEHEGDKDVARHEH